MILRQGIDGPTFRKRSRDCCPRLAAVGALDDVRLKVASLMVVDRNVHRVFVMQVRLDVIDVSIFGNIKCAEFANSPPVVSWEGVFKEGKSGKGSRGKKGKGKELAEPDLDQMLASVDSEMAAARQAMK